MGDAGEEEGMLPRAEMRLMIWATKMVKASKSGSEPLSGSSCDVVMFFQSVCDRCLG